MDSRRWEEVRATFEALVELDAATRGDRLTALGSTDPELRAAVESLLGADSDASERLSTFDSLLARPPTSTPDFAGLAGRTLSHFRVLEPFGAGGMGVVYRAEDTRLGRVVALKFLRPEPSSDPAAKARFLREARSVAALDHPNLCTLLEVGETEDGRLFLAMPLYPGETLKARLDRDGPLPAHAALEIARQIAQGLKCAHAAGLVHRDLKPGNVMLLPDGTVKILDFGLAKAREESLSSTGALLGTVAYMAPEQIRGAAVDARADLWALGVVLYEMLTGRRPFTGEHHVSIAHAILHDDPAAPTALRDGLPSRAEAIVLTLLQKDPRARYAAAEEVIADLARVESGDHSTVRDAPSRRLPSPRGRAGARTWRVLLGAALAIGAAAGAVFVARPAIVRSLRSDAQGSVSRYSIALPDAEALAVSNNDFYRIAISPSGEYLAYVGATRLWLRKRDELHATAVAGAERAIDPFFSPDGSRLGFVAADTSGASPAIKVVPVGGGTPTTVIDSAMDIGGAAWGRDGYIYYDGHLKGDGIARVRETGGRPEALTVIDRAKGDWWHYQPEPLPNGRGVLFVVAHELAADYEIAVLDLASGVIRRLLSGLSPRYAASGHIVYATAGGTLMAVPFDEDRLALTGAPVPLLKGLGALQNNLMQDLAISANGTLVYTTNGGAAKDLVWVTRDGAVTPIDSGWRDAFTSVALSPDGTALAVGVDAPAGRSVWIKRLDRGRASTLSAEGAFDEHPVWTPDGQSVMFLSSGASHANPGQDLYVTRADGRSPPRLLLGDDGEVHDAEYSRDGRWLVYQTRFDLFAMPVGHDSTRIPLLATKFTETSPRLSPDGRWLAYMSNESGQFGIYVRPFPNTGSATWRISPAAGGNPIWSPSGREIFYKSDAGQLMAVRVRPGARFSVAAPQVLFPIDEFQTIWQVRDYDVSPDGRRFVMIRQPRTPRADLIVVEGFFGELKARVGP